MEHESRLQRDVPAQIRHRIKELWWYSDVEKRPLDDLTGKWVFGIFWDENDVRHYILVNIKEASYNRVMWELKRDILKDR